MATRASNAGRSYSNLGQQAELPVIAADIIWEGSMVSLTAGGLANPLVAAEIFAGFCAEKADNSAGAASAIRCKVHRRGDVIMDVVGVTAITDVGALVYASDDDVLTLTSTSNTLIGRVIEWLGGTKCRVYFEEYYSGS